MDFRALGCDVRPLVDDGVVICPGLANPGPDEVSRTVRGGGAVVKDGMDDRGKVPAEKLGVAAYSRGWSTERGLGRCGGGGGGGGGGWTGGRGSWPREAGGGGCLGATACLML